MAETLLSIDEASKELNLTKDQVLRAVKSGLLRGFRDQKTYKFRRADIDAYKKAVASNATVAFGGEKSDKVDIADIESESGVDEADQTSVMAPLEAAETPLPEEKPAFEFSEQELGLSLEDDSTLDEEGKEILSMSQEESGTDIGQEETPASGLAAKKEDLTRNGKPADSILVADESESSMDILDVAEESSSDTHSSDSKLAIVEESSSGEEVPTVELEEESDESSDVRTAKADTVVDILSKEDESSDEEFETIDLDEVVETQGTPLDTAATETATIPLAEEVETMGITPGGEATQAVEGEEGAVPIAALEEGAEEAGALPEGEEVEAGASAIAMQGWEIVIPSKLGNALLMASILVLAFGGIFLLSEVADIHEVKFVNSIAKLIFGKG